MDPSVTKLTQTALSKFIKKPPLTDKLLSKPPFRFLHDIITEVNKVTSFFKGLYSDAELNSQNVKEKDSKIAFLQKAIDVVVFSSGEGLSIKPSKVVAGHEPESTNLFLQTLGKMLSGKVDSTDAVTRVLNGEKPGASKKRDKESANKAERDKPTDDAKQSKHKNRENTDQKEESKEGHGSQDRSQEREERRPGAGRSRDRDRRGPSQEGETGSRQHRSRQQDDDSAEREHSKERDDNREKDKKDKQKKRRGDQNDPEPRGKTGDGSGTKPDDSQSAQQQQQQQQPGSKLQRPSSAKGQRRRPSQEEPERPVEPVDEGDAENEVLAGPTEPEELPSQQGVRAARPQSARPAPPRIKAQEGTDEHGNRTVAAQPPSSVIIERAMESDSDEDNIVVEDPLIEDSGPRLRDEPEDLTQEGGEHGGLVKKILETKKELDAPKKSSKNEKPIISDAARRKEKEMWTREIEKLRQSIQTLCRSANPLGKVMDYLQEDIDSMHKELQRWHRENAEHQQTLSMEQGITNSEVEPLRAQLAELDGSISHQQEVNRVTKANISRNEAKIQKMISSISFSSRT